MSCRVSEPPAPMPTCLAVTWQVWFSLWWRKMKRKGLSSGRGLEGMELMVLGCCCGKGWGMGEMPAGAISRSIWSIQKCIMYWKSGSCFSFEMWLECWRETKENSWAIEIFRSLKRVNWIVQTLQRKIMTEVLNWSYWILHVYNLTLTSLDNHQFSLVTITTNTIVLNYCKVPWIGVSHIVLWSYWFSGIFLMWMLFTTGVLLC